MLCRERPGAALDAGSPAVPCLPSVQASDTGVAGRGQRAAARQLQGGHGALLPCSLAGGIPDESKYPVCSKVHWKGIDHARPVAGCVVHENFPPPASDPLCTSLCSVGSLGLLAMAVLLLLRLCVPHNRGCSEFLEKPSVTAESPLATESAQCGGPTQRKAHWRERGEREKPL